MALVRIGYTIPGEAPVAFTCDRSTRRKVYYRLNMAYATGGVRKVRAVLASGEAGNITDKDREN